MEKIQEILKKIEVLPASPVLLSRLLPTLADVNANFDDVVKMISMEQTLTAKLLQICNSAFFGCSEPVATVADAVNQVGYQPVYLLAAMVTSNGCFPKALPNGFDTTRLWKHSVAAAFSAKFAAESVGEDENLMLTAGLMHDIGKIVVTQLGSNEIGIQLNEPSTRMTSLAEYDAFGCTHSEVGAMLLEKWDLPEPLIGSIRYHHNPDAAGEFKKMAACVAVGNLIAHRREHSKLESVHHDELARAMAILGTDAGHLEQWEDRYRESAELVQQLSGLN